ncbi:unnamed protein product, partial [Boreogadus saida]
NLDTEKLSDYFAQHLGGYVNVLSALESLNIAILKAMDKTKEEYQGASVLGQFVTRFMLRETSSQLLSLQRSLQYAMEAVEEQSCPQPRTEVEAPAVAVVQKVGRRCGRRANENRPSSPGDQAPSLTTGTPTNMPRFHCRVRNGSDRKGVASGLVLGTATEESQKWGRNGCGKSHHADGCVRNQGLKNGCGTPLIAMVL